MDICNNTNNFNDYKNIFIKIRKETYMSYNPFNLNDLCNPTKLENYINPLSPLNQCLRNNHHASSDNSSNRYYQEPKKKYEKTKEDEQSDAIIAVIVFIIFIIGTIGGTIGYFK